MFFVASVDAVSLLKQVGAYGQSVPQTSYGSADADLAKTESEALAGHELQHTQMVAHTVEVIDGYLLATIMLIFAFGLYELFISRIDVDAQHRELASRVLLIRSLDDLKDRLAKVVLLILIVKYFEHALGMKYREPLDLVQLALGITLIAVAIFLSSKASHASDHIAKD